MTYPSGIVAVLISSTLYIERMRRATALLVELGVPVTERGLSAHRTPEQIREFAKDAEDAGYAAIICGASRAAHVAGVLAAQTTVPVIGVPFSDSPLGGADALYSTVQMPEGFPVATVAVDGAFNAGFLAAQIIATTDPDVRSHLTEYRARIRSRGAEIDAQLIC